MKLKHYSLLLLALFGMAATQVRADELTTTEIDGVTYYEIGSAEELVAFADLVNDGQYDANGILTDDIDLTVVQETTGVWEAPIGTISGAFTGIFDGQGHKITNFDGESFGRYGLFGNIKNATVMNFSIAGKLTAYSADGEAAHGAGAIGWSESSHIINVHSALAIEVVEANVHHVGGVVGSANYNNFIKGCTFSGTLTEQGINNDCFGGVVGYTANDTILFCANYGTVTFTSAGAYAGGIAGYLNNADGTIKGCLNAGKVIFDEPDGVPSYGGAIIGRLRGNTASKLQNNVWLEGSAYAGTGENSVPTTLCVTEEQLASGMVCYYLNCDQSEIGWYQTLNFDEWPIQDATHKQVYMNGRLHCDGTVYEDVSYSNQNTGIQQDEHNFDGGICSYCGLFNEDYLTPNEEGFYEIATAKELVWFEQLVNKGKLDASAVLVADIDFADLLPEDAEPDAEINWTPIGDWGQTRGTSSAGYQGHFDGQGHTIKNLNATSKQNYFGLFGVISTGSLIENFDIYGTYHTAFQYAGGVAAYARDNFPTIRNIHSFVDIYNSYAGGRQGGILGGVLTTADKTIIENCTYSGTLDGNDAGGSGNYGGIVGYVNNNGNTVADITNCLFDGKVVNNNEAPGGCTFGGFVGYSNGGVVTIKNCLSYGTVESAVYGMFFGAVKSTKSSLPNSFYVGEPLNGSASTVTLTATQTNSDELSSGEICWKLNEESFLDPVWHQTVGEEGYPKPYGDAILYQTPSGYETVDPQDEQSVSYFINSVIANEQEFLEDEDLMAYQALIDEYKETIDSWEGIVNYDEFIESYKASLELKESIMTSAANYAAYVKECEDAITYLEDNELPGLWAELLKTYLEQNIAPNSDYPNGSYSYITANLNLDDEALAQEIAFVKQMLQNAIAGGVTPGTEITRLVVNSDFANDYEGWTVETDGGTATVAGQRDIMSIPEGYNNKSFTVSQTLTGLDNGLYLVSLNGLFRAGTDINSQFYAGQLFINGIYNYFMSPSEDIIDDEEAEVGVNCLGEGSDARCELDGVEGWVPNGRNGCSYAFSAGRYLNYVAAEVTDGTLTIGVRNLGTGLEKDWLPFGNLRLWYLGSPELGDDQLADVLQGYVDRANVIINFFWSDYEDEYFMYPNMSEDLKTQLSDAVLAAKNANVGTDKMDVIYRFSQLFNEVYACRKAYIAMEEAALAAYDFIYVLADLSVITEEELLDLEEEIASARQHYSDGDVSAEDAERIAERMKEICQVLPVEDGVYQLATAEQVKLFSAIVNNVDQEAKAVLTADIDMSEVKDFEPIGRDDNGDNGAVDYTHAFKGVFDGQGHKITNFGQYIVGEDGEGYYTMIFSGDAQGFFGLAQNAEIKNFSIDGAFMYDGGTGFGAIGWAYGTTITNVHSSLQLASNSKSCHIGGVCGDMRTGSSAIQCSFSGSITDDKDTHDCIGGIGGYSNEYCLYQDCVNYGTVEFSASNAYAGGICGYVNNDNFYGVVNCLNVGEVMKSDGTKPDYGGAIVGRLRSHAKSTFENNFMLAGSAARAYGENSADVATVGKEQLASGEVCYKLNGDQENIVWFQTITEDLYPTLNANSLQVFFSEDVIGNYYNLVDDVIVGVESIAPEQTAGEGIFNLAGQRMSKMQKGINIVGGKKILVK